MKQEIKLFDYRTASLSSAFTAIRNQIKRDVDALKLDILTRNEDGYVQEIMSRSQVPIPTMHFDQMTSKNEMKGDVVVPVYGLPYEGDVSWLQSPPTAGEHPMFVYEKFVADGTCIWIDVAVATNPADAKRYTDEAVKRLEPQVASWTKEASEFNEALPEFIRSTFKRRRDDLARQVEAL